MSRLAKLPSATELPLDVIYSRKPLVIIHGRKVGKAQIMHGAVQRQKPPSRLRALFFTCELGNAEVTHLLREASIR